MNGFKKAELKGRNTFAEFCAQMNLDISFTEDPLDRKDFILRVGKHCKLPYQFIGGEIKNRNPKDIKYDTHILDVNKIINLLKFNKQAGFYVLIFGEDMFIYNVRKIALLVKDGILKIENKLLPNSTVLNKGTSEHRVVLVPKNYGVHYKRIKGEWINV